MYKFVSRLTWIPAAAALVALFGADSALASEASLKLPAFTELAFFGGTTSGASILMWGLVVCALGMGFGLFQYMQLKNMAVHKSMLEISELIYATCQQYLITQGKFIAILWIFIGAVMVLYFGFLIQDEEMTAFRVAMILGFSLVGIAGSYGVAWFGIRVNTFANSRTAFASLRGKPFPTYSIPLQAGMSIGMVLILSLIHI